MLIDLFLSKFWGQVDTSDSEGCWPWVGKSVTNDGYGTIRFRGKKAKAHRVAYTLLRGEVGGWLVCHKCDNPPCCNPAHLYLGTDQSNATDKVNRGRHRLSPAVAAQKAQTHCAHGHDLAAAYIDRRGRRLCRECHRVREQVRRNTERTTHV